jgi:Cu2+-exporting ATPase
LNAIDGVQAIVFLDPATATITMEKHIQLKPEALLTDAGKYTH